MPLHLHDLPDERLPLGLGLFIDGLLQGGVGGILLDLLVAHPGGAGGRLQGGTLLLQGGKQRLQFVQGHIGQRLAALPGGAGVQHPYGLYGLIDLDLILGLIHRLLQLGQRHFIHLGLRQPGLQALGLQRLAGGLGLIDGSGKIVPVIILGDLLGGKILLRPLLVGGQGGLQRIAGNIEVLHIGNRKIGLPVLLLGQQLVACLQLAPVAGKQRIILKELFLLPVDDDLLLQDIQTLLAEGQLLAGGVVIGLILRQQHLKQLLPVVDQRLDLLRGVVRCGQLLGGQAALGQGGPLLRLCIQVGGGHIPGGGNLVGGQPQGDISLLLLLQLLGGLLLLLLLDVLIPLLGHQRVGVQGGGIDIDRFAFAIPHRTAENDQTGDELIGIGVTEGIVAGGKGQQAVARLDIHGGFDDGALHDLFDIFILGGIAVAVDEIMVIEIGVIGLAHHHRKDLIHILAVDAVVADKRVLLVVGQLLIGLQIPEHGTVAHIVAVNDGIVGGLFLIHTEINIGDAPVIVLAVDIRPVVFIVILGLYHGVVQLGIRNLDPAGDIGIALVQRLKAADVILGIAIH